MNLRRSTIAALPLASHPSRPFGVEFLAGPPQRGLPPTDLVAHDIAVARALAGHPALEVDAVFLNLPRCLGAGRHCVRNDAYVEALVHLARSYRVMLEVPEGASAKAYTEAVALADAIGATLVVDDCFGAGAHPSQHAFASMISIAKLDGRLLAEARRCRPEAIASFRAAVARLLAMYGMVIVEAVETDFDLALVESAAGDRLSDVLVQGWRVDRAYGAATVARHR